MKKILVTILILVVFVSAGHAQNELIDNIYLKKIIFNNQDTYDEFITVENFPFDDEQERLVISYNWSLDTSFAIVIVSNEIAPVKELSEYEPYFESQTGALIKEVDILKTKNKPEYIIQNANESYYQSGTIGFVALFPFEEENNKTAPETFRLVVFPLNINATGEYYIEIRLATMIYGTTVEDKTYFPVVTLPTSLLVFTLIRSKFKRK